MAPVPSLRPSSIDQLVSESEALEAQLEALQEEPAPTGTEIAHLRREYRTWHARARQVLSPEARKKFDEHRDGGIVNFGISQFLSHPRKENVLKGEDGTFPLGKWQYPFERVRDRLEKQRALVLDAAPEESPSEAVAADLAAVLRRLPELLRVLNRRRPEWALGDEIKDERDLQVVVEALLRMLFDDVRPEDYVPSRGGANSRVDFVLPEVGVVVETKMTRASMSARNLGEELLIDAGRYPRHPDCSAIVAYVYDPDRRLDNPRGIERDLTMRTASGQSFICVIS